MNRAKFFDALRTSALFGGRLSTSQVIGMSAVLDRADKAPIDDRWLAYMFATDFHETDETMRAISENLNYRADRLRAVFPKYFTAGQAATYAGKPEMIANRAYANRMGNGPETSGDGWRYRGRGLVQITGKDNYAKFSKILGVDLVGNPDKALDDAIAVEILFVGLEQGSFTRRKLADYFTATMTDFEGARAIVNPDGNGKLVAGHARILLAAIEGAR